MEAMHPCCKRWGTSFIFWTFVHRERIFLESVMARLRELISFRIFLRIRLSHLSSLTTKS